MKSKHVFQDGREFYIGSEDQLEQTVTAPMRVTDFDCAAASNARDWFVKVWCPMHDIEPEFAGETF